MKRFYFTVLCAVLSLSGCVNNGGDIDEPTVVGRTTLMASTEQLVLNIGAERLNGVETHQWSTDEALGAFGSQGGANAKYTLFNKYDGMAEGQFFGAELKGTVYAYYPYSKDVTAEGAKIALTIPDTQIYNADLVTQYEQHSKLFAARAEDGNISFEHLYGCLAIEVAGDYTVTNLRLTSETEPLAGRVAFDFENNMQSSAIARSLYELSLDCGAGVPTSAEEPTKFFFLLPPATYTSLNLEISTPEGRLSKRLMGAYTINRFTSTSLEEQMTTGIIEANFTELSLAGSTSPRLWEEGEQIGIFSSNSQNTQYLMASAAGANSASFIGMESKGNLIAYYPYSSNAKLNENKMLLQSSDLQQYDGNMLTQFQINTPFMVATAEEGNPVSFNYVMGLLGMRVNANMKVKYIEVSSASKPLSGRLWVDLANGYTCSADEVGTKSFITLDASVAKPETKLDDPTTFYVTLPAGEYEDLLVTITSTEGDILAAEIKEKVVIKSMDLATITEDITYQTIDVSLENVSGVKSAWNDTDIVAVYSTDRGKGIKSRMLTTTGSLNNQVIAVGTPEESYNLFYPASILSTDLAEEAMFEFPNTQKYNENAVATEAQIYAGTSNNGKATLYFLNSILAVEVTATYANCEISSLLVSSKNNYLAGTMTVNFDSEERPACTLDGSSKSIRILFEEPVVLSSGDSKVFYISIPVGLYEKGDITVSVGAPLGAAVDTSILAIDALPAEHHEITMATIKATNLTEEGKYSNTFVMPNKKGWYMFDAKIRGGLDKDEDGNEVITPTAVAGCLFEKNSGMITDVAVCNNAKSVSFYYDGSKGNASVATFDDGGVLWAWYLWCPADEQPQDIVLGSNTYMDRNLGSYNVPTTTAEIEALTDVTLYESGGLFFQWGRPSPFPTVVKYQKEEWASRMGMSNNTISQKYYYPSAGLITKPSYGAGGNEAKKAHQYFYSCNNVYWTSSAAATKDPLLIGCYLNDNNNRWWDSRIKLNVKHDDAAWNYSNAAHKQYDPCPYGYELPFADTMIADFKAFASNDYQYEAYLISRDKGIFKGAYYYIVNGSILWLPAAGGRPNYGLFDHFGSPNASWAGYSTSSSNKIRIFWGEGNTGGSSTQAATTWTPSMSLPVRCVKQK